MLLTACPPLSFLPAASITPDHLKYNIIITDTYQKDALTQSFLDFTFSNCHCIKNMIDNKICPKCRGAMKVGNYTGVSADWERNGEQTFLKQSGYKIVTYACEECGYMESYVDKKFT